MWIGTITISILISIFLVLLTTHEFSSPQHTIKIADALNYNSISPSVTDEIKVKLRSSIDSMKKMGPGVSHWKIIYCNGEKIILYNYAHVVACDISEKNKGIYSIIELKNLKVGSYQGSNCAAVYPSPDAMACVIGTIFHGLNSKYSLYFCNFFDGSVKEIEVNYNIGKGEVEWYKNPLSSSLLPWYVSIHGINNKLYCDAEKSRKADKIPVAAERQTVERKYMVVKDSDIGYYYPYWWKENENKVIGVPYRKIDIPFGEIKLIDFEIIEVNMKDKSVKVLYKIDD